LRVGGDNGEGARCELCLEGGGGRLRGCTLLGGFDMVEVLLGRGGNDDNKGAAKRWESSLGKVLDLELLTAGAEVEDRMLLAVLDVSRAGEDDIVDDLADEEGPLNGEELEGRGSRMGKDDKDAG
jgi:hypothetical protein